MTKTQDFVASFGFVISFLVGTMIFSSLFGEKVTALFLLLVLASMVLVNQDRFTQWMGGWNHV